MHKPHWSQATSCKNETENQVKGQRRIQGGGAIGAKPPLDQRNLLISGCFQAPTGAEPPLDKFLNTPLKRDDESWLT